MIRKTVTVNRGLKPKQVINATDRTQYVEDDILATMPRGGEGKETVTVEFFTLGRTIGDEELAKEYKKRGLKPDPYAVSAVNQAEPDFSDNHPNGTHWQKDGLGWCFVAFRRTRKLCVDVDRNVLAWDSYWWFGGVRQPRSKSTRR